MIIYALIFLGGARGGAGGIFTAIAMFTKGAYISALLATACSAAIGGALLLGLLILKDVAAHFRSGGHSIQKATSQAGHSVAANEGARNAAFATLAGAAPSSAV